MSEDAKEKPTRVLVNKKLSGHPDPTRAYQMALGTLTMNFSKLHFLLERLGWQLWGLVTNPAARDILTKDLRLGHLVDKLRASANGVIPKAERPQFLALLKRAKDAAEQRNELLHSLWIIKDGEPISCISRKRGELNESEIPSVEDIQAFNTSLTVLADDLLGFWLENGPFHV